MSATSSYLTPKSRKNNMRGSSLFVITAFLLLQLMQTTYGNMLAFRNLCMVRGPTSAQSCVRAAVRWSAASALSSFSRLRGYDLGPYPEQWSHLLMRPVVDVKSIVAVASAPHATAPARANAPMIMFAFMPLVYRIPPSRSNVGIA